MARTKLDTTEAVLDWAVGTPITNPSQYRAEAAQLARGQRLLKALEAGSCWGCGAEPGCNIDCVLCAAMSDPQ